jgi:hypothetical protein
MAKNKRMQIKGTTATLASDLAKLVLRNRQDPMVALLGPVVWTIPQGSDQKRWYFALAYGQSGKATFQLEQIHGPLDHVQQLRDGLMFALLAHRPIVVHECGSELIMAQWMTAQFPGERSTAMLENVKREQADG